MKGKYIGYVFIAIALVFNIILFFVLPDSLVMQISGSGDPGTILPKPIGLGMVFAIELFLGLRAALGKDDTKINTWIIAMVIVAIVNVLILVFNI
ncbi:MAG: hypothetical protein WC251_03150 [Candidatus Izemoplasmatales bacterium]|jgi:hypothetical protein|nr:hypothetical protein [Candidatus Izemoplasmatales bacterium]